MTDRERTRLNSSHTEIYTLSLHDPLPTSLDEESPVDRVILSLVNLSDVPANRPDREIHERKDDRSGEDTSELQSHRDLHSFPTRPSSHLARRGVSGGPCHPFARESLGRARQPTRPRDSRAKG